MLSFPLSVAAKKKLLMQKLLVKCEYFKYFKVLNFVTESTVPATLQLMNRMADYSVIT